MQKIVVNRCYGGFGLSYEAVMLYAELAKITLYPYSVHVVNYEYIHKEYDGVDKGFYLIYTKEKVADWDVNINDIYFSEYSIARDDPLLVKVVEKLKNRANGDYAKLEIIEIPDGVDWVIGEYDGIETVEEAHRSW